MGIDFLIMKKKSIIILAVVLCLAFAAIAFMLPDILTAGKVPYVIVDCDLGYMNDDALALSMLLKAEEEGKIKLLGITLEGGNNFISAEYENYGALVSSQELNAANLLEAAGRQDIPVIKGTDYPMGFGKDNIDSLAGFYEDLSYLEDCDTYGAIHFFTSLSSGELTDSYSACDFLIQSVKEHKDNLVIIALGPVMNIARAVEKEPSFASGVSAIYYMGGAFGDDYPAADAEGAAVTAIGGANVSPYCEYNACYDASAFQTCLTAGFPLQYISPGETTADIDQAYVAAQLEKADKDDKIAALWLDFYENNMQEYPYWDPIVSASFLKPASVSLKHGFVSVNNDRNDEYYAMTSFVPEEKYVLMSDVEKTLWGEAYIITGFSDFWDFVLELL